MKNIYLVLIFFFTFAGFSSADTCDKYKDLKAEQISSLLNSMDKTQLSHELYVLGECKIERSIPVLKTYISDERITHHALHKGMKIGQIASGSISKIKQ